MKIPLSDRLKACAGFVASGDRVADIGCDHGYLSIYLLSNGIARSVIASDVNEEPLQSAIRNSEKYGVRDKITFYLSDGVRNIPRDFDVMVCAGMGADTMIHILDSAPWLKSEQYRLILQCQSKRPELRRYLHARGWSILREDLAQDGKFIYTVMEVRYTTPPALSDVDFYISPALRQCGSPLLPAFIDRVTEGIRTAVIGLEHTGSDKLPQFRALLKELEELQK